MITDRWIHADTIETIQFCVSAISTLYALVVMRAARRDRREYAGNGGVGVTADAVVERTTTMLISQAFLLLGGAISIVLAPPNEYSSLNDQGVFFRVCVICSTMCALWKSRREQQNRRRIYDAIRRQDRRASDRSPGSTPPRRAGMA